MDLSDHVMSFGKYKGKKISEIPHGYLLYLYDRKLSKGKLKKAIEHEVPVLHQKKIGQRTYNCHSK